jgi:hypothetical protein
MSRHTVTALTDGISIAVGWDNALSTYFAQVAREPDTEDDSDPIAFWIGGEFGEVRKPEDLVAPLAPYATLTTEMIEQLRADRVACLDRGPTVLQREMLNLIGRRP